MKTNPIKKLALVALAGLATMGSANAATTYNAGDFLLGFRFTSGATNVAEVNLGPAASLVTGPLFNVNTVLEAALGTGWASNSNFRFGGGSYTDAANIFYTKGTTAFNPGTQSSTPANPNGTGFDTANGNILAYNIAFDNFGGTTYNGGLSAVITTATANNYSSWNQNTNGFASLGNIEDAATNGGFALDLYSMQKTPTARVSSYIGTITLASNGDLAFNAFAVPEPGRASLGLLAGVMLLLRRRRA
jgi:hypothetical protein